MKQDLTIEHIFIAPLKNSLELRRVIMRKNNSQPTI